MGSVPGYSGCVGISSWCWEPGFSVDQHDKVVMSAHCHKSVGYLSSHDLRLVGWLLGFYILWTFMVISRRVLPYDSAHPWRLHSAARLGHQAASTMIHHSVILSWQWASQSLPYPIIVERLARKQQYFPFSSQPLKYPAISMVMQSWWAVTKPCWINNKHYKNPMVLRFSHHSEINIFK